jgi:hypothetical protein
MSRSLRRLYAAITGLASAKSDKQMAHRGVRREQKLALEACADYENLLLPHWLECPWNNNWCWGRDGAQIYHSRPRESDCERIQYCYRKLLRK